MTSPSENQSDSSRNLEVCAELGQELIRRYKAAMGIENAPIWCALSANQRQAFRDSAKFVIGHAATAEQLQEWWAARQIKAGWKAGHRFDKYLRTDPMIKPWDDLVLGDQVCFSLFRDVVAKLWRTLRSAEWSLDEAIKRVVADEEEILHTAPELSAMPLLLNAEV